jgi:hypothetical protein
MDRISLTVPAEPAFHGTLRLVVGGVGSRLQLPYEQVNELQLAVETLVSARVPVGPALVLEVELDGGAARVTVGPFASDPERERDRVVERLVRQARVVRRDGDADWVELSVGGDRESGPS